MKRPRLDCVIALLATLVLSASVVGAQQVSGIISVPGQSTELVTTDALKITLDLATQGTSFSAAKREADDVATKLQVVLESLNPGTVTVHSQFVVLKHKKISWSSKAKRLDHRITIVVEDAKSALSDVAVTVVDKALASDPRLAVSELIGQISDKKTATVRADLLARAVKDCRRKAEVLADGAGLRVTDVVAVSAVPGYGLRSDFDGIQESIAFLSVRGRSFTATSRVVDELELRVDLVAQFKTEPR